MFDNVTPPNWAYIAGFTDGEGCLEIVPYDNSKYKGNKSTSKGVRTKIAICQKTTNDKVLKLISKKLDDWGIKHCFYSYQYKDHTKMSYISIGSRRCIIIFLKYIMPHLIVKKDKAKKLWNFCMANPIGKHRGEKHGMSKLTDKKVKQIRKLWRQTKITKTKLAKKFGVSFCTIHNVIERRTWNHVK